MEVLLDIRELLQNPPEQTVHVEKVADDRPSAEKDELFEEAVKLFRNTKTHRVTAHFLHDFLQISYGRASTLIDQLEAAGIISAPDPVTHRRKVV